VHPAGLPHIPTAAKTCDVLASRQVLGGGVVQGSAVPAQVPFGTPAASHTSFMVQALPSSHALFGGSSEYLHDPPTHVPFAL
jgi:hypothetical protein